MSTYKGALLSVTDTPLWAAAPRRIAAAFGASAMASGAAALTIAGEMKADRALDRIALAASALKLFLLRPLRRRFRERSGRRMDETGWAEPSLVGGEYPLVGIRR
ncbi:MAG: hypothetical protein JOZ58_11335, partial [Acetobacteraceae bacterium]|nr:hypothetical protein [Acetobacteraceae bacterium]